MESIHRDTSKRLAIVVPVSNEARTIRSVLAELLKLQPDDLIVVENGSTDGSGQIAKSMGARVLSYETPLGNDVPRAVGALATDADIYLFTDSDLVIPAEQLLPLIEDIESGADMAMNAIDWCARYPKPDAPSIARYYLNLCLGRRDLGLENVLTIPHAFSRKALDRIGKEVLANPLLATALVIYEGLAVTVPTQYNVLDKNRARKAHMTLPGDKLPYAYQRMHGDATEAFAHLFTRKGPRFGFGPGLQDRSAYDNRHLYTASWVPSAKPVTEPDVTLVLSISHGTVPLRRFLEQMKDRYRLIPVVHSAEAKVTQLLERLDIPYIHIPHFVGHNVAFAIGAEQVQTPIAVFHDTLQPLDHYEIHPFAAPIRAGKAHVVVNDQSMYVGRLEGMSPVLIGNYYLNIVANEPELTTSAINLPPYGIHVPSFRDIGWAALMNPSLAQIVALERGLTVIPGLHLDIAHRTNVHWRPVLMDENTLIGDQLESLYYWVTKYGYRGGFNDGNRQRHVIPAGHPAYLVTPPVGQPHVDLHEVLSH
ncbi:glycosyltransferase [Alicyclobacillus macrosporangiidus]|uniref:Glycosyltransferase involved in cell wall bisynthesis n=1 Tax=Alicyclobacillus macrosporangiidus TaxID=392015 RepID=A0A1I7K7C6_9BACL|nr:glycosyltransferase [Alicyclobacillus macrosporangiidus]SFU93318.1 Glycosyltransferase involved in cell wall bisynthesis [Alicyclobacillus macrosporangiidus]